MPTYEYKCKACDHTFEKFQSMSAKPVRKCPACGKMKVERLISGGAGLIFKGSGFYITDYRSDSYNNAAKSESGESKAASTSDSSKSDGGSKTESTKSDSSAESSKKSPPKSDA